MYIIRITVVVVSALVITGCSTLSWHQQLHAMLEEPESSHEKTDMQTTKTALTDIAERPASSVNLNADSPVLFNRPDRMIYYQSSVRNNRKPDRNASKIVSTSKDSRSILRQSANKRHQSKFVPPRRLYSIERGWFKRPLNAGKDIRTKRDFGRKLRLQTAPYDRN